MNWLFIKLILCLIITPIVIGKAVFSILNDDVKIRDLIVMGTHDSSTFTTETPFVQTQTWSFDQQLEMGIRFFDIRVRRINNNFAIHHGLIYLHLTFNNILSSVDKFLHNNPQEFVFLMLKEEYKAKKSNLTNCEILNNYIKNIQNIKIKCQWSFNTTINEIRGQILLMDQSGFSQCINPSLNNCTTQNDYQLLTKTAVLEKWEKAKKFHLNLSTNKAACQVNFLSGTGPGLILPQSIALGASDKCDGSIIHRLEHIIIPGCRVGDFEGMNKRFCHLIETNGVKKNSLYIVLADFPDVELIDAVNEAQNNNTTIAL